MSGYGDAEGQTRRMQHASSFFSAGDATSANACRDSEAGKSRVGEQMPQSTPHDGSRALSADPDRDLVARARAGERAAFEALLRRHYDRMHRIAWRLTGSAPDEALAAVRTSLRRWWARTRCPGPRW